MINRLPSTRNYPFSKLLIEHKVGRTTHPVAERDGGDRRVDNAPQRPEEVGGEGEHAHLLQETLLLLSRLLLVRTVGRLRRRRRLRAVFHRAASALGFGGPLGRVSRFGVVSVAGFDFRWSHVFDSVVARSQIGADVPQL